MQDVALVNGLYTPYKSSKAERCLGIRGNSCSIARGFANITKPIHKAVPVNTITQEIFEILNILVRSVM